METILVVDDDAQVLAIVRRITKWSMAQDGIRPTDVFPSARCVIRLPFEGLALAAASKAPLLDL